MSVAAYYLWYCYLNNMLVVRMDCMVDMTVVVRSNDVQLVVGGEKAVCIVAELVDSSIGCVQGS